MKVRLHRAYAIGLLVVMLGLLGGCMQRKVEVQKIRDLDFEVLTTEQVGSELSEMIEGRKTEPFRFTYQDGGMLYICVGYGEKPSGGYSITVEQLMEAGNAIYVHTNLLGPTKEDTGVKGTSYPNLIICTRDIDKVVVFE